MRHQWAKFTAILLVMCITIIAFSGCRGKDQAAAKKIYITYYKYNEDPALFEPLIEEYESINKNVQIVYQNFTSLDEYEERIINEMAEGEGPDIFSIDNTWMSRHWKKISPLPLTKLTPEQFEAAFVDVTAKDLIRPWLDGQRRIFALPLGIDALGLYYNKAQFEEKIPNRGKPASTWEGIQGDVFKLTVKDPSSDVFQNSGIALGRADNISHAVDILYLLMKQYKTDFYNQDASKAMFGERQGGLIGQSKTPGADALAFFTSFAKPDNKNYSWNESMTAGDSGFKEIEAFASGKLSMFIGYAADYQKILNAIAALEDKNLAHINSEDVKAAQIPQVSAEENIGRITYTNYFAETVSRNSKNPLIAWDFLMFLASKKSQKHYFDKKSQLTTRRDLIEEQKQHPIYGVFISQLGFAESLLIYKDNKYKEIFSEAIMEALKTDKLLPVLQAAEAKINFLLPRIGLIPVIQVK